MSDIYQECKNQLKEVEKLMEVWQKQWDTFDIKNNYEITCIIFEKYEKIIKDLSDNEIEC